MSPEGRELMRFVWMCIEPDDPEGMGVQIMLRGDPDDLVEQIFMRLASLGAKLNRKPTVLSGNTEYVIYQWATDPFNADDVMENATGLNLKLYPCRENGANIDVDPIEPRGE
jgi:hypothetical protein